MEVPNAVRVVQWKEAPEPELVMLQRVDIVSPIPGRPVWVWAVNDRVEGADIHWIDGRSRPCRGPENGCPYAHSAIDPRWYGYLGGWDVEREEYVLALVTKGCWDLSREFRAKQGELRGSAVELYRATKKARGLVLAKIHPNKPKAELPPPLNVREILLHIWSGTGQFTRKERRK
jgi:hypothetical protein